MLIPLKWLKEYTDVQCGAHELAREMTFTGSKAEGVRELGADIDNVVVGRLLTFERHPDADKLFVSDVDVGRGAPVRIVTGADNIRAGDVVPIALDKSTLPGGKTIKATKMRGIVSEGMMCSIEELNLSKADYPDAAEDGIMVLDPSCKPGADIREVLGLDDSVIDFEITTNRPDCLSVLGLAREAAATMGAGFTPPKVLAAGLETCCFSDAAEAAGAAETTGDAATAAKTSEIVGVEIQSPDLCYRYTARAITGVTVGESPDWMKIRLRNCGIRPINNIVDVTNYVMLETGQPLHAFDARFVEGGKIIVRNARDGEPVRTLDGDDRALGADVLVIADANRPIAVAGVMGGENSEILPDTKTVIIESANFNGTSVRRTARKLGMRTESSSRFEKGLDPNMTLPAADRAAQLIVELGAGVAAQGYIDVYPAPRGPVSIAFNPERINALLGTDIGRGDMLEILRKADLAYNEQDGNIIAPTYRVDMSMEADLAEEVARFYGYNNITATLSPGTTTTIGVLTGPQRLKRIALDALLACGYSEIYTFSFQSPKVYDRLRLPADSGLRAAVRVANPLNEDMSLMRTTALPEMFKTISDNYSQRISGAAFFELASVYSPAKKSGDELYDIVNAETVDVAAAGEFLPEQKSELTLGAYGSEHTFFTMKGVVENLLGSLGVKGFRFSQCADVPYMHPGRSAYVLLANKKVVGLFGEVRPEVADAFSLPDHALSGVLSLDALFSAADTGRSYDAPPKYPPIPRDLSLLIGSGVPAGDIMAVIKKCGGAILESASVFDVYVGAQVPEGQKSIAFSLVFRSGERTLKDDEVASRMSKIVEVLGKEFNATLRS
ncbi:MAG: phenylalanine--tRNA ligase subunit beta [Oscillospiraceae bacterium]|nr:phenylalanine--tRNA ligase subunit beta [Oscillospiraceae bacterium]